MLTNKCSTLTAVRTSDANALMCPPTVRLILSFVGLGNYLGLLGKQNQETATASPWPSRKATPVYHGTSRKSGPDLRMACGQETRAEEAPGLRVLEKSFGQVCPMPRQSHVPLEQVQLLQCDPRLCDLQDECVYLVLGHAYGRNTKAPQPAKEFQTSGHESWVRRVRASAGDEDVHPVPVEARGEPAEGSVVRAEQDALSVQLDPTRRGSDVSAAGSEVAQKRKTGNHKLLAGALLALPGARPFAELVPSKPGRNRTRSLSLSISRGS